MNYDRWPPNSHSLLLIALISNRAYRMTEVTGAPIHEIVTIAEVEVVRAEAAVVGVRRGTPIVTDIAIIV